MASSPYVKSLFWLLSIGGLGYGLMLLTAPSEDTIEKIRASTVRDNLTEDKNRKVLFLEKLQEAANLKERANSKGRDS